MSARIALLLTALLVGCASVDERMNTEIRALAQGAPAAEAPVAGSQPHAWLPWAVGQWCRLAVRQDDVWMEQRVSVVGEDAGGWWLEVETRDPRNKANPQLLKMQVRGYDPADPRSVGRLEIGTIYTQSGQDRPMQAPPFIGPMTSGWVLANFRIDTSRAATDTVTVPAGTFAGAAKLRVTTKWGPIEAEGDTWLHSAVPIWGIVKQTSTDGDHELRLLAYSTSGATSRMRADVLRGPGF